MILYVAGKYRADNWEEVAMNVKAAEDVAAALLAIGYEVICPHSMTHGWERYEFLKDDDFLRNGLALLRKCDAVYVVGDYSTSEGTKAEIIEAVKIDIPVFDNFVDLQDQMPLVR